MKLSYTLGFEDWEAFTLYVHRTAPSYVRMHRISRNGVALIYGLFGLFACIQQREWVVGGALLGLGFAWWTLFPHLVHLRTRRQLKRMQTKGETSILGDYHLETSEKGLYVQISGARTEMDWGLFSALVRQPKHAFLMLDATRALVIPLRGQENADFVAHCQAYLEA